MSKVNPQTGLTILDFSSAEKASQFSSQFSKLGGINNVKQLGGQVALIGGKKGRNKALDLNFGTQLFGGPGLADFGSARSRERLGGQIYKQNKLWVQNFRKEKKLGYKPAPLPAFEQERARERYRPKQQFLFSKQSFGFAAADQIPKSLQKDIKSLQRVADRDVGKEPSRFISPTFERSIYSKRWGASRNPTGLASDVAFRRFEKSNTKGIRYWTSELRTGWVADQERIHNSGRDAEPGFYAYRERIRRPLTPPSVARAQAKNKIEQDAFSQKKTAFQGVLTKVGTNISEAAELPTSRELRRSGEFAGNIRNAEASGRQQAALAISRIGTGRGPGTGGFTRLTLIAEGRIKVGKTPREQKDIQNLARLRLSQLGVSNAQSQVKRFTSRRGRQEISRLESIGTEKRPFSDVNLTKGQKTQLFLQKRTAEQSPLVRARRLI